MKILVIDFECNQLEVVHLTEEEKQRIVDARKDEEYGFYLEYDAARDILGKRGVYLTEFNPRWIIEDDDKIPVFDEEHQEEPLLVL